MTWAEATAMDREEEGHDDGPVAWAGRRISAGTESLFSVQVEGGQETLARTTTVTLQEAGLPGTFVRAKLCYASAALVGEGCT